MGKMDIFDYFLEELSPVMKSQAWESSKEVRLYLTEEAKRRARQRWSEANLPNHEISLKE